MSVATYVKVGPNKEQNELNEMLHDLYGIPRDLTRPSNGDKRRERDAYEAGKPVDSESIDIDLLEDDLLANEDRVNSLAKKLTSSSPQQK